jgi:hypothetical protein
VAVLLVRCNALKEAMGIYLMQLNRQFEKDDELFMLHYLRSFRVPANDSRRILKDPAFI